MIVSIRTRWIMSTLALCAFVTATVAGAGNAFDSAPDATDRSADELALADTETGDDETDDGGLNSSAADGRDTSAADDDDDDVPTDAEELDALDDEFSLADDASIDDGVSKGELDVAAPSNDEIEVTVSVPDADPYADNAPTLTESGAAACAATEMAIESARIGDQIEFETAVYQAFNFAPSAGIAAIESAGARLLDSIATDTTTEVLNDVFNACVGAGYGV
jgi:hypothetical protein